ncbi:MAG: hypothetical protein MUE50_25010, partial [Pirellulaceae bacterium]|nr:hypothetical protein [Pirellulaceae bacterium]
GALQAVGPSLQLAVERPWLYTIVLNGKAVPFGDAERWLDSDIRKASIGSGVQAGENRLELEARPMQPLCEIMPVYVLGDFRLTPNMSGFTIDAPRQLELGSWNEQGLPFYADKVAYRYTFSLDKADERFALNLPRWSGAVAVVRIDGVEVGVIAWPPDQLEFRRPLAAGEHRAEIVVAGNMKNLMGPHFSDGLPGIWSWRWSGQKMQPPGNYKFAPCGLLQVPSFAILE